MLGQTWSSPVTLGFIVALVLALWAVFNIAQSRSGPFGKAVWIALVLCVPFVGFLLWLFLGPRTAR